MKHDPLDGGLRIDKAWEEFRASYSQVLMNLWFVRDLESVIPHYPEDLRSRLNFAIEEAERQIESALFRLGIDLDQSVSITEEIAEAIDDEGPVAIPGPFGGGESLWGALDLYTLKEQLFPHTVPATSLGWSFLGLAVVGLHSALESLARGYELDLRRISLPRAIERALSNTTYALAPATYASLVEFDETRHLFVHHRGIVTEQYINHVQYNKLLVGEFRPLVLVDLRDYANLVWGTANAMWLHSQHSE